MPIDYPFEKLKKQFESIPEDVRAAISSIRVVEQLQEIGKKHRLHIDKIDVLFDEAGAVMLGLTHPRDFIGKLAQKLDIDKEKAKKIAQNVNEEIFKPIRKSLKKIHRIAEGQPIQPTTKPEVPTPEGVGLPADLPVRGTQAEASAQAGKIQPPIIKPQIPHREAPEKLDKEKVLKEIEKEPAFAKATAGEEEKDIVEEKLKGAFRIPREESEHKEIPEEKKEYKKVDPYREPTD